MNSISAQRLRSYIEYNRLRLASDDTTKIKRALQDLCELYRKGARHNNPTDRRLVELQVLGVLRAQRKNQKIVMWACNTLAFVGSEASSTKELIDVANDENSEPQVIASSTAALYKICKQTNVRSSVGNGSDDIHTLAALRYVPIDKLDFEPTYINIETQSPDILKLALILVGTGDAPEHLFDPRYTNPEIVRVLGSHDDDIVRQYCAWAAAENPLIGFDHLGIPFGDVQEQPANVRAWMYETLCNSGPLSGETVERIEIACRDLDARARAGLAHGLRERHIDGIEPVMLDWIAAEGNEETRGSLFHHFAANSTVARQYHSISLEIFADAPARSEARSNILAAAQGTPLYADLRRLQIQREEPDIFPSMITETDGSLIMPKNEIHITGDHVQIGSISGSGNSSNSGDLNINSIDELKSSLSQFITELKNSPLSENQRLEAQSIAQKALDAPNRNALQSLGDFAQKIDQKVKLGVASGETWAKLLKALVIAGGTIFGVPT